MTGEVADGANGYQHPMAWSHLPSPSQRAAVKRTLNSTALASVLEEANIQNQTIPFPRALAAPRATPGKRRSGPGVTADTKASLKEVEADILGVYTIGCVWITGYEPHLQEPSHYICVHLN